MHAMKDGASNCRCVRYHVLYALKSRALLWLGRCPKEDTVILKKDIHDEQLVDLLQFLSSTENSVALEDEDFRLLVGLISGSPTGFFDPWDKRNKNFEFIARLRDIKLIDDGRFAVTIEVKDQITLFCDDDFTKKYMRPVPKERLQKLLQTIGSRIA